MLARQAFAGCNFRLGLTRRLIPVPVHNPHAPANSTRRGVTGQAMDAQARKDQLDHLFSGYQASFPEVPSISATELHDLLQGPSGKNVVMVDTRTDEERAVSRIPGNVLSKDEFEDQKASYKNSTVVAYCTAGLRSGKYLKPLRAEGYDTRNLKGSIVAWTQEGFPLVAGPGEGQATNKVHVYGDQWKLQGDSYEAITFNTPKGLLEGARSVVPKWLGGTR